MQSISTKHFLLPLALLTLPLFAAHSENTNSHIIEADFSQAKGPNTHFESLCVGAGRAAELLRKAAVDQLKDVHENCGFQYLRFHGLFHDELNVYSKDQGKPVYNFQHVDMAYDALIDNGMKPFVELSFMPQALSSGTGSVFWWNANTTPPKDLGKWGDLVHAFTAHMEERYGKEELKKWFFEVWNEPNLPFFSPRNSKTIRTSRM